MDINIAGNSQTANAEARNLLPDDTIETNVLKHSVKENIDEHLTEEKSGVPKQPIEILKVELVAAGRKESVEDKVSNGEKKTVENIEGNKDECSSENCRNKSEENKNELESVVVREMEKTEKIKLTQINDIESITNLDLNEVETNDKNEEFVLSNDTYISHSKTKESQLGALDKTTTGLGLLAQYDSDSNEVISDSESVMEVPPTAAQDYRNQVVEITSDSDSDSSGSSDVEYLKELRKTIEKHIEVVNEDEEYEDETTGKKNYIPKLKVKGELLLEDLPPIHDLQITVPEDECIELGKIHSIVEQLVLVSVLPNSILLDLDTVIFLEKGQKVLGEVFDVLGQVADPLYCVRFNSNKQIKEKQVNVGDVVYVAPKTQYTQYVILSKLMTKGSDASWENDMEPPPRFLDYSDDEQEQLAKRQQRNKDRSIDNDDPTKRLRTVDEESSNLNRSNSNAQQRNHYTNQKNNNRGGVAGNYSGNTKPRYSGPQNNEQRTPNLNYNRSSWHSNYYPQSFISQSNYGTPPGRSHSQIYSSHASMYAMPTMHNLSYPPPPQQYGSPPMLQPQSSQPMPSSFSIRPPTLHRPPLPYVMQHHQQYTSPPPPPPGSQ